MRVEGEDATKANAEVLVSLRAPQETTPDFNIDSSVLDQVRGVLFAASNLGEEFFAPVSTLAVRNALHRRGRETDTSNALAILARLRDVQALKNGFWLPVSTIRITCDSLAMIVSGQPTDHLQRDLRCEIHCGGIGRFTHNSTDIQQIPEQPFSRWLRAPESTAAWTKSLTERLRYRSLADAAHLQYFDHWTPKATRLWLSGDELPSRSSGFVLARAKSRFHKIYLITQLAGQKIKGFAEIGTNWSVAFRVGYGLTALASNHRRYLVTPHASGHTVIRLSRYLPIEELTALQAFGAIELPTDSHSLLATVPNAAVATIERMLHGLGLARVQG